MSEYERGFEDAKRLALAAVREVGPVSSHGNCRYREQFVIGKCIGAILEVKLDKSDNLKIADLERQLTEERAQSDRFEKMLDEASDECAALERQLAEARERLKDTTDDCERVNREWHLTTFHRRVISNREWLKANGGET